MKLITKILIALAVLAMVPVIIGLCMPRDRQVVEKKLINQMYFMVLGNISNHWEESSWRHNLDTMIQQESIDGQDCWVEYYTNGDSVKLITQNQGEFNYIRLIVNPDGREFLRGIVLMDYEGRTAVRMYEEVSESDPLKRFCTLFYDPVDERLKQYLSDLEALAAKQNEDMGGDGDMFFGF